MKRILFLFAIIGFFVSCSDEDPGTGTATGPLTENDWLVPESRVLDGGPGKDGIPSIDAPQFSSADQVPEFMFEELVVGIVHDGIARAYPHSILDWHEIVNDDIGDLSVAITYCPLTGTGIGWSRIVNGKKTTFGVSGLLFDSNLMPYDRETDSTWSQQRMQCVNGELRGENPEPIVVTETTLNTWLEAYPDSEILNDDTGFSRSYGVYPYGDYRNNNGRILFPLTNDDDRLPSKERVLGIFDGEDVYAVAFSSNSGSEILNENIGGQDLVVVRNTDKNFIQAFWNPNGLDFSVAEGNNVSRLMVDGAGNTYNLAGEIVDGPNTGGRLEQPVSFIGYWFSWGTFYPDTEIL